MKNNQGKKYSLHSKNPNPGPVFYEIKVQDQLDPLWSKWFEGMTLRHIENGESEVACTLISGPVIDQPALHSLLTKIGNLNLTLVSVRRFIPRTNTVEEVPIRTEPSEDREDLGNKS